MKSAIFAKKFVGKHFVSDGDNFCALSLCPALTSVDLASYYGHRYSNSLPQRRRWPSTKVEDPVPGGIS